MLSRNFRLQKIGDLDWLLKNYNFSEISNSIDELIVLDIGRREKKVDEFCFILREISKNVFVPISAGGGINSIEVVKKLLRSGADKVVINTEILNQEFIKQVSEEYGSQSIVASVDLKLVYENQYKIMVANATEEVVMDTKNYLSLISESSVGELYLNSIERDGTGQGFDLNLLELLPVNNSKPVILAGGAGNSGHLLQGLLDDRVSAVTTANLLNFVGNGLTKARVFLLSNGQNLAIWRKHSNE